MTVAVLTKDCAQCGRTFNQPRRRGRPAVTCSEECKKARGRNGDVRLDQATNGTGFVGLDWSHRHNGEQPSDAVVVDVLGEPESDARGWSVVFVKPHGDGVTRDYWQREEAKRTTARDRASGLPGGLYVGETCPRVGRTIGQADAPHDWQERLDAAQGWRCR